MKYIITFLGLLIFQQAYAANIKYFESKTESKEYFKVINSKNINLIYYDEADKELDVWMNDGSNYDFKVDSSDKANEIIIKLLDDNDNSFVTLTES